MDKKYHTTIGLEVHAELKTATKMFCCSKNDPDEVRPNVNICPVCMAHPGTLPVINKRAVEHVVRVGLAIDGTIADFTEFDRKNYFYPDIPKGYQISQYKYPIVSGGLLAGFEITRAHLEEDTANSKHYDNYSLVDFNRAGVPLMELVTEPHTFETAENASKCACDFAKEFQLLLRYLGASKANMEKGEMRVEANISVSSDDPRKFGLNQSQGLVGRTDLLDKSVLGTKVEVKNLNSFRTVERAIKYEVERMIELHEGGKGNEIVQETRGWDEKGQKTFSQRKKESSHDYRYFPDPDLPKLKLSEVFDIKKIRGELPELPSAKRRRYKDESDFELKDDDIESYVNDIVLGQWFDSIAKILKHPKSIETASNYITSDFLGLQKANLDVRRPNAENFAELINMVMDGDISSRVAKDILAMIVLHDENPKKIAVEKGLIQKNDEGAIKEIAQKIIDANSKVVTEYKAGKEASLQFLIGQVMKESKGSANPQIAKKVLIQLLQ